MSNFGWDFLPPSHPGQCVVLIVEEEVLVRNVSRIILESEGYFVLTAGNNEEALEISGWYRGRIHVLLAAARLPVANRLILQRKLSARHPDLKLVLMSSDASVPDDVPVLHKPFKRTALVKAIKSVLRSRTSVGRGKDKRVRVCGA